MQNKKEKKIQGHLNLKYVPKKGLKNESGCVCIKFQGAKKED